MSGRCVRIDYNWLRIDYICVNLVNLPISKTMEISTLSQFEESELPSGPVKAEEIPPGLANSQRAPVSRPSLVHSSAIGEVP